MDKNITRIIIRELAVLILFAVIGSAFNHSVIYYMNWQEKGGWTWYSTPKSLFSCIAITIAVGYAVRLFIILAMRLLKK